MIIENRYGTIPYNTKLQHWEGMIRYEITIIAIWYGTILEYRISTQNNTSNWKSMNTSKVYTVIHTHHTLEVLKSTSKKVFWDILKIIYLIGCLYSKSKVFWDILKILYLIGCFYSKSKVLVISEKKRNSISWFYFDVTENSIYCKIAKD